MDTPLDVVGRASAVLRAVSSREPVGSTTSEIARATGLARPTVHRLLTTLLGEGMVDRDPRGRWLLGAEMYLLGITAAPRYDVSTFAQPIVRHLSVESTESAFFSARRGNETVCLLREDGSFPIRSHVLYEGIRFPLGVASAGLAILAHLPDAEITEYLSRVDLCEEFGPHHNTTAIRERIAETRFRGYSVNRGHIVEGSWGIGAAVFDRENRPAWALTLTGIESRFSEERLGALGSMLLQSAHDLGRAARQGRK